MLREHVDSFIRDGRPAEVFEGLISILDGHGYAIVSKDRDKGVIVIRYLALAMNMLLWRCWSDKVMIRTTTDSPNKTRVDVYAIPNMFRVKVGKNEGEQKMGELLDRLRGPLSTPSGK
jgi:hypothetical protein